MGQAFCFVKVIIMAKIVVYVIGNCLPCDRAVNYLNKAFIPYEIKRLESCEDPLIDEVMFYENGEAVLPLIINKDSEEISIGCPYYYEDFLKEIERLLR